MNAEHTADMMAAKKGKTVHAFAVREGTSGQELVVVYNDFSKDVVSFPVQPEPEKTPPQVATEAPPVHIYRIKTKKKG